MKTPSLTDLEKQIVKRLLQDRERQQDVHHKINIGRNPTVNFGRLSGAEKWDIDPASDDQISRFDYEKSLIDLKANLSPFEDERVFRAREAMKAAVLSFNSPSLIFKNEIFCVLSQIAWTYLMHEYFIEKGEDIEYENGNTWPLSYMINREDCPLGGDVLKNLKAIIELRNLSEHKTLNSVGRNFWPLFQANCLNFDQVIRKLYGDSRGLGDDMAIALHFSNMGVHDFSLLQKYDLSPDVEAIDTAISDSVGEIGNESAAYKFKVNYSFESASKGDAHIVFKSNNKSSSIQHSILSKKVVSDELWPYKPNRVVEIIREKADVDFNQYHHLLAWKKFAVRPKGGATKPEATNKKYCQYHTAHGDYTYSDAWVDMLTELVSDEDWLDKLKSSS